MDDKTIYIEQAERNARYFREKGFYQDAEIEEAIAEKLREKENERQIQKLDVYGTED